MKLFLGAVCALLMSALAVPALADPSGAGLNPGNTGTQSYMSGCVYRSGAITPSNGQQMGVPCDASGALIVNAGSAAAPSIVDTAPATAVSSTALAANQIVVAAPAKLYSFSAQATSTLSAAPWWVMIYNAVSAPADGAVTPLKCYALPTGATGISAAFPTPITFSVGITVGVSTTGCFTKTASAQAFLSGDYR